MIRVVVADDNAVVRHGLVSVLASFEGIEVVGEAANGQQAIDVTRVHRPEVVLLDVRMPVLDGVSAAATLSRSARVLMLTYDHDDEVVAAAIRAGAQGYLVHGHFDLDELERAVKALAEGLAVLSPHVASSVFEALRQGPGRAEGGPAMAGLTTREREIMGLLALGLANHGIAERLFLSEKTVKNHLNRIFAKLGVATRAQATAGWLGLIDDGTTGAGGPP